MAVATVADLIQVMQRLALLEPPQLAELARLPATEPRALGRLLLDRGWLTPFQTNQLLLGRGAELRLGSYLIRERLPPTPAGEVFVARHLVMRRLAEIVVVRAELLARPEAVAQFYDEVAAVSRLCSPHLVAAYDAGPTGDSHFVALEHVEGSDLQTLVARHGPLPVEQACGHAAQAALGLQHAWERGLPHHDLRPANLLVTAAGVVKVRNLGLSILQARTHAADDAAYRAPEGAGDLCAELYSLGGVLFFLLTGQAPGSAAVRLDALWPDVQEPLAALVGKLLAPDPAARCQSFRDVRDALSAVAATPSWQAVISTADDSPSAAVLQSRRVQARRQWRQILVGASGLLAAVLAFGLVVNRQMRSTPVAERVVPPVTMAAPSVPGAPALVLQCGKSNGAQQVDKALPGFAWRLVQGENFDGWDKSPKRHCWFHGRELRFELSVPPGTAGLLRLHCIDGDSQQRKQRVFVQGRLVDQLDSFTIPGRTLEVTLTPADTRTGKIDVRMENLLAEKNAVVSTVEFLPLVALAR